MSLVRKLKPDRNISGAIIPLSMIPIFALSVLFFGRAAGLLTLSALLMVLALLYLYIFLRTYNLSHLAVVAEGIYFSLMLYVFEPHIGTNPAGNQEFKVALILGIIFFDFIIAALIITRKFKWRGREVFELAGELVDEIGNGYTSRPRPVGKVEYSPQQMHGFARFCSRHLIALPYYTSKNITLVPVKMGEEFGRVLGVSGDFRDATWVNFAEDGEVSVHITHKDYLDYRESLAFDQLCVALGQVFIDFFELYIKGEGVRVVDRMDDLKIGILS
jgi:hypothetical protein